MQSFPEHPSEIPSTNEVWEQLAIYQAESEEERISEADLAATLYLDKLRLLNAVAIIQASIVYRAVRACDLFFEWKKRQNGTKERTYLRPRVRVNKEYSTVEMVWVRAVSKSTPAGFGQSESNGDSYGRTFEVKRDDGAVKVHSWYQHLKKGASDRYSDAIFKNEPLWARKLGSDIEDTFEQLRKEQKTLTVIRRAIGSLDACQTKQFSERVQMELKEWTEDRPLKSIYNPSINLKADSD